MMLANRWLRTATMNLLIVEEIVEQDEDNIVFQAGATCSHSPSSHSPFSPMGRYDMEEPNLEGKSTHAHSVLQ